MLADYGFWLVIKVEVQVFFGGEGGVDQFTDQRYWGGGGGQTWDDWSEDIFMLLVVMSASLGDD